MENRRFLYRLTLAGMISLAGPLLIAFVMALIFGVILLIVSLTIYQDSNSQDTATYAGMQQPGVGKGAKEIPPDLLPVYQAAGQKYGIPWSILAAIHKRETSFGRSTDPRSSMISSAGALGPMQFLPSTFREYAVDGDGDGRADIWNEKDAIFTATNFLAHRVEENKRNPQRSDKPLWWAIWDYNHADWYVSDILTIAKSYESEETVPVMAGSSGKLVFPLARNAQLTSGFGMRVHPITGQMKMHTGIDLAVPVGTPVLAAQGGVVTRAGWTGGYGYMVEIYYGGGFSTRYGHLSKILVQIGQPVQPGQPIALSGSTGDSTGPHLHFETRVNGVPQDPLLFLH